MARDEQTNGKQDMITLSVQDNEISRGFLKMLVAELPQPPYPGEQSMPLDLSLRLSVGGACEGSQKEKTLNRSWSTVGIMTLKKDCGVAELPNDFLSLSRSSSLPVRIDSERGKREVNVKGLRIKTRDEWKKGVTEKERISRKDKQVLQQEEVPGKMPSSPSKIPAWAAASAARNPALNRALAKIKEGFRKLEEQKAQEASGSNASIIKSLSMHKPKPEMAVESSQPKMKLEMVEESSQPKRKLEMMVESSQLKMKLEMVVESSRKPNGKSIQMPTESKAGKPIQLSAESKVGNPPKRAKVTISKNADNKDYMVEMMKTMPSVMTTGPNGIKVEGFLCRYLKGQVRIICSCHGRFLSAEEFVKHAGAKDGTNPMKQINVISNSFSR